MDFVELEAIEGLRWTWNSWPSSKMEAGSLIVPLSVMYTPLTSFDGLPQLPYEPLICGDCSAVLNPYSRVDYPSRIWTCAFCSFKNPFPGSYTGISEQNLPAELFPTYSTVEYVKGSNLVSNLSSISSPRINPSRGLYSSSNSLRSIGSGFSMSGGGGGGGVEGRLGAGPAFVFVVDCCAAEEEIGSLRKELLLVLTRLPENALVGLVTFDGMVQVRDLGFSECSRVVVFHGERELSSEQVQNFLGIYRQKQQQYGKSPLGQKQTFLQPLSECEFSITSAIEEIRFTSQVVPGNRPLRCTGVAISAAIGLLETCSVNTGSRIMLFTSGPATVGPGIIVDSYLGNSIRTHRDIINGRAKHYAKSSNFYKQISDRLSESSIVLDLFACSLNQVGAAELKVAVERSGGFMMFGESFDSDQFRKSLRHIFTHDEEGHLKMSFDATIELVTTKDLKIVGALGPCVSLQKRNTLVSDKEIGESGTYMWKMGTLTNRTCFTFFFQVNTSGQKIQPDSAFFLQFITRYRHGNMGIRKRVTTVARRWVGTNTAEIAAGFDQEAAASVMARLAIHRAERSYARDNIQWLDDTLVCFASKFGEYVQEDASSFRLSSNFSLYPQFMYYLRRSQFIDIFNSAPDETAFLRLMLNREGVVGSLIMIQPTLFQYSFDGPPIPVLLDVRSIVPDVVLLFDSYFCVVIHYSSKIAHWKKLGYHKDPSHENLRKLLEAPEVDTEQLVADRIPTPKLIKCDQHSSQARFLLAKLNPSVTHNSIYSDNVDVIFTDDLSLQNFVDHLQELAVQG